jgi:hypothetical protein
MYREERRAFVMSNNISPFLCWRPTGRFKVAYVAYLIPYLSYLAFLIHVLGGVPAALRMTFLKRELQDFRSQSYHRSRSGCGWTPETRLQSDHGHKQDMLIR